MTPTARPVTADCERWIWIELLGFDITAPDLGVGAVLERLGFIPDAVSLLLFNADVIHTHGQRHPDRPYPDDICSYAGHPGNEERRLQPWTPRLLRQLVATLQAHGTRVFVSVFDLFRSQEWIGHHPELLQRRRHGQRAASLCPWKHLADGRLYEDVFCSQLEAVLVDIGFDGFHCADGFAHQRLPIAEGDLSDDMVGQFLTATGLTLPAALDGPCDDAPERLAARADWIEAGHREAWISFYAERITRFMAKLAATVHGVGGLLVANTAWTKDPLEALYRYGVDYRANADAGIDAMIVEAAAGAAELDGYERVSGRRALHPMAAALLLNRACMPKTPLLYLNGIKDTTEEWCLLRHTPPLLEADILALSHLFQIGRDGRPRRAVAGPVACLADGLSSDEWRRLRLHWDLASEFQPERLLGATVVWSDAAHAAQLHDGITTRRWTMHRLLHHLMERGAPLHSVVRLEDAQAVRGPLVVLQSHVFPADELQRLVADSTRTVILIGAPQAWPGRPDLLFFDPTVLDGLAAAVYGLAIPRPACLADIDLGPDLPADLKGVQDPAGGHAMFYYDLPWRRVSNAFLQACNEVIQAASGAPRVSADAEGIRVQAMADARGRLRLLIGSDAHDYRRPAIDVGRPIRALAIRTAFPATPGAIAGSVFSVRVPGRGMVVVDIDLEA